MAELTTGQRAEVRARLAQMLAETAILFMRAENLRIHLEPELLVPVNRKLAELVEVLAQLKGCVAMSAEEPGEALARLEQAVRAREVAGGSVAK